MYKHLFGPVPSRRLGISLGVDLVPFKTCTLNCIYCECQETTCLTVNRKEWVPVKEIKKELATYLQTNPSPDFVTLAGSGEPLLNTGCGQILSFLKEGLGDIKVRTAVLTNGTLLTLPEVRSELDRADLVIPSLDAATEPCFRKINRPHPSLNLKEIIRGLKVFCDQFMGTVWIEVFIVPGINDTEEELMALKDVISYLSPDLVQLNTLDRPGAINDIKPASMERLLDIVEFWGLPHVEIIAKASQRKANRSYRQDTESAILATIARRPCTLEDITDMLGLHPNEVNKYLRVLETDNKIKTVRSKRGLFYQAIHK